MFTTRLEVNAVVKKKACVEPGVCRTNDFCWTRKQGQKKRVSFLLGRFGFRGIGAHTIVKELVILQFRKCFSEAIVDVPLRSIVDDKSVVYSRVFARIRL